MLKLVNGVGPPELRVLTTIRAKTPYIIKIFSHEYKISKDRQANEQTQATEQTNNNKTQAATGKSYIWLYLRRTFC